MDEDDIRAALMEHLMAFAQGLSREQLDIVVRMAIDLSHHGVEPNAAKEALTRLCCLGHAVNLMLRAVRALTIALAAESQP
jgi:hypothetical protein